MTQPVPQRLDQLQVRTSPLLADPLYTINSGLDYQMPVSLMPGGFVCEGRLTLTSGNPTPQADVNGGTTIYYTPYVGNHIRLINSSGTWQLLQFSQVSCPVPSTVFNCFDIFGFIKGDGTLGLETQPWPQLTGIVTGMVFNNSAPTGTVANPAADVPGEFWTIITSPNHGLSLLDEVGFLGINGTIGTDPVAGRNGWTWRVRAIDDANHFRIRFIDATGLTYTSGGTWYRIGQYPGAQLSPNLQRFNGVLVKAGDPTRLYLGCGVTDPSLGQCTDRIGSGEMGSKRGLVNYYNRIWKTLNTPNYDSPEPYSPPAGTANRRFSGNRSSRRFEFILPDITYSCFHQGKAAMHVNVAGTTGYGVLSNQNRSLEFGRTTIATSMDQSETSFEGPGEGDIFAYGFNHEYIAVQAVDPAQLIIDFGYGVGKVMA